MLCIRKRCVEHYAHLFVLLDIHRCRVPRHVNDYIGRKDFLFDVAHVIGVNDARKFHKEMTAVVASVRAELETEAGKLRNEIERLKGERDQADAACRPA